VIGLLLIGEEAPACGDLPFWQPARGAAADAARQALRDAVAVQDRGEGVLLLSEETAGRAVNLAISILGEMPVDLVTGANRAIIEGAQQGREMAADRRTLAAQLRDAGREAIIWYSDFEMIT